VHAGKKPIPAEIAVHLAEHYSDEALTGREIEVLHQLAGATGTRHSRKTLYRRRNREGTYQAHFGRSWTRRDRTQASPSECAAELFSSEIYFTFPVLLGCGRHVVWLESKLLCNL